ncbi:MAG: CDP-diacylglycerol--serine O-phosphatidyltransferase [Pseudobdellovibrionaceae bacterium]
MDNHVEQFNSDGTTRKMSMYIYVLPNLVTTANIFCGFYAVIHAIKGNYLIAAYAIVAASVFDQLDGRLARMTRSTSKFGAEYDSLCDLLSFGLAPSLLLYLWALQPFGRLGWVACFLFVTCGALRLARFNVQANVVEKNHFQGLPIPMAAGIVASSVLAYEELQVYGYQPNGSIGLLVMTIGLALVMVSNFPYRNFKDLELKQRMPFHYLVIGLGGIGVIALWPELMLFVFFLSYALIGAVFGIFKIGKSVRKLKPSVYSPLPVNDPDLIHEDEFGDDDGASHKKT